MESYSHFPQLSNGQLDLSKIQDAQLMKTKPNRGKCYTAGKSCITGVVIDNKPTKPLLDPGAFSSCVGKSFLETCAPNFEDQLLPIDGIKFNSARNAMKALGIFETNVIFTHINGNLRLTVEFVVMENFSSTPFILGNDYLIMYGIDLHNNKDRYFTIGDNKHQKFAFYKLKDKLQEAFASEKEPLGEIIGHEADIILNIERPYPPLLRRPSYPESNEEVEITTPVIVAWHNGKSRTVGDFRALNTYTVPDRYPIPKIQIALTQVSQALYITIVDSLKGFHHNVVTPRARKYLRIIVHCGGYEYLRMPFVIKNVPSHFQRMMNEIFPDEISEGWLIIYIDDIIFCSKTCKEHM
ncbi:hypothetical protein O181_058388 [Austropuccinia psidii MF-1]|uniref:Reverse transcriptase domain-containing protein n=1 Tax=Austropuccinia psidii MF-1 TaxID=1389203 RepID=A0A9Q3ED01_9BASI|nr:hypothetical protein [Austropuccinia psidii MF-1]